MKEIKTLFKKELILKSKATTQEEVFKEVGQYLLEKNLITINFIDAIISREDNYPTGIDLSVVEENLANVAIPHTDMKYCKTEAIVFVKLEQSISFQNMIRPEECLDVWYLFFILNNEKPRNRNILSELMDFLTIADNMHQLNQLETTQEIYEFLKDK